MSSITGWTISARRRSMAALAIRLMKILRLRVTA
jgi:hypothetical protein